MKAVVITIGVAILVYIIKAWIQSRSKPENNTSRPSNEHLPKHEKPNDKLVIVDDLSKAEMESILTEFCNLYNQQGFQALPRLYELNGRQFAIAFPFDMDFEMYCCFVNYVHYPLGLDKSFSVTAWVTTKQANGWITERTANKRVMLFIPEDDIERDNVFLTTEDNIGYKLGFAMGEEKQLLQTPKKSYLAPTIDIKALKEKKGQDFQ
jgi:nitrogen fixation protein